MSWHKKFDYVDVVRYCLGLLGLTRGEKGERKKDRKGELQETVQFITPMKLALFRGPRNCHGASEMNAV